MKARTIAVWSCVLVTALGGLAADDRAEAGANRGRGGGTATEEVMVLGVRATWPEADTEYPS